MTVHFADGLECSIGQPDSKAYRPIDCGKYDYLEMWALHKQKLSIQFADESGRTQVTTGTIVDLQTFESVEYLSLDNGIRIRLDRLISASDG